MRSPELRRLVPSGSGALCEILDSARGAVEPPIRSEVFGPARFAQHGRSLGDTHRAAAAARSGTFFPRLRDNITVLREAHSYIGTQASTGYDISPAAEWLLDNFHLIEAQLKEIHEGLPRRYFRSLPVLIDEPLAGLPRVYGVAWAFVAHTDGAFDEDLLSTFLVAYQETRELTLREVWALPTTLRVVLVENLRRLAERVATNKAAREVANLVCDALGTYSLAALDHLLSLLNRRGVGRVFLAQMAQRLQDRMALEQASGMVGDPAPYHEWLHSVLPDLAAVQMQQPADQAADNLSVSNAVMSLRAIGDADWPDIVCRSSPLMRHMLTSPVFAAEDARTRDQTLHRIEVLARRAHRSELAVAEVLVSLMRANHPGDGTPYEERGGSGGVIESARGAGSGAGITSAAGGGVDITSTTNGGVGFTSVASGGAGFTPAGSTGDIAPAGGIDKAIGRSTGPGRPTGPRLDDLTAGASHWLVGAGHPTLLNALDLREGVAAASAFAWHTVRRRLALPAYLGALLLGTLGLVAWMLLQHPGAGGGAGPPWWLSLPAAALMLFPASEAVVAVINRLISESARPRLLPRLALSGGIPAEHRVMVVIPALLTDSGATAALAHRLLLHHLANPEPHAQFALLTDWADADTEHAPGDDVLLQQALEQVLSLNKRHGHPPPSLGTAPRFILLHRERRFSETEQRWIGWERKRGKLEQLIATLAAGAPTAGTAAFMDLGEASRVAPETRYVVTLDSDTQLPPGRLRELVGVAAHPQNQPRLGPDGRTVVGGYGILQPHVATPLPAPRDFTLYHWLFAGQCGIDPYSAATSEIYQDLFGEGTFTGKGLLNVQAMHAALNDRLPVGRVLSHDLLEGSLARCATVTDISIIEDAPFHADVAASRVHRWTRGDWQLLPFLLSPRRYPMRAINRWKMFDNLRRSLVAPVSLALVLLALATGVVSPWAALALVFAAFAGGPMLGAAAGFSPSRDDVAKRHFYSAAATGLARAGWGAVWHVAQLLQHALKALDAIGRALYRMAVSQRRLLQWTTAQAAQASASTDLPAIVWQHRAVPFVALLLGVTLWMAGTVAPALALVLCLLWAGAPLWTWWASRPRPARRDAALPARDQRYLESVARDTWRLFERCVVADDNHLPPDNLQTAPHDIVAHRTSPTNIGLYLLSTACARRFGWIGNAEMLSRLEATLATLGRLQRHRGHFLNWYDTQSCAPLLPMYVSTVDSGNLCGHLLAVGQACLEFAGLAREAGDTTTAQGLDALAERFERLAWEPEFGFLYHRKRHLFHIGYRVAERQLDTGFYDLLASEARLTSVLAIAKGDVPVSHWASLGRPFYAVGAVAGLRSWSGSMFEYLMPSLVLDEPHGSVLRDACRAALREQIDFAAAQGIPWGMSESAYAGSDHTLAYQYSPQGVPRLALRRTPPDELVVAPYATALAAQIAPHRACLNFAALETLQPRGAYGFIEALDFSPARQAGTAAFTPVFTFMSHHQGMTLVALANVLLDGVAQRWGMGNAHIESVASLLHERAPREVSMLHAPPLAPPPAAMQRRPPGMLRDVAPGAAAVEPTHVLGNGRYSVTLRANGAGWSRRGATGITRWRDDALRDALGSFFYLRWPEPARDDAGVPDDALPGGVDRRARGPAGTAPRADTLPPPRLFSITQHPAPDPAARYQSVFHADRVCLTATWRALQAMTTVWVSPEDDIEFRQVELRNQSDRTVEIELISAFEVSLSDPRADEAHPAFANLFVAAEWHAAQQALVFERRPRLPSEKGLQAAHFLADRDARVLDVQIQTDRQRWQGRNHGTNQPMAQFEPVPGDANADGSSAPTRLDTGLDPMCAMAVRVRIAPFGKAQLTFATAASDDAGTLRAVIDKYRQPTHVQRASLMSATLTGIRLRALRLSTENFAAIQTLTTALVLSLTRPHSGVPRAPGDDATAAAGPGCDRRLLWRFGISGDRPIVLVSAGVAQGLGLMRTLAQALRLWSWGGIGCDLVVVNAEPTSYLMALHRDLTALRDRHGADSGADAQAAGVGTGVPSTTGFHVLRSDELSREELATLHQRACVRFNADGRPLLHHMQEWAGLHEQALDERQNTSTMAVAMLPPAAAAVDPSTGDFATTGGEFRFDVSARLRPARPWINVLSNPSFGAQLSEAGGGYTWAVNSRLNQLTAWSNDPVCDPPSEWFLLQDLRTLRVWSVTPSAWGDDRVVYRVSHGQGHSVIQHRRGDVEVTASWCVDPDSAVKQVRLRIVNRGQRNVQWRLIGIAEWMMGANRSDRGTVYTALFRQRVGAAGMSDAEGGSDSDAAGAERSRGQKLTALMATQRERSAGFGGGTAFFGMAGPADEGEDWTCDRRECFDARGRLMVPDHFGCRQGSGLDPCAALATPLSVRGGEAVERVFLLGYADSASTARQLATAACGVLATQRLERVSNRWDGLLNACTVKTPDPLFDVLVNRWLLYQTVVCRLWAKAGFYQAGGATGYRDQLQDAMALAWAAPDTLRRQILIGASRQFVQGDVQHWWHAPMGNGVRTHFSDDLLWLPHACVHYVAATGDGSVLDERVPFIEGDAIPDGAEDSYHTPTVSEQDATVFEHAARTIDRSLRVGEHGLPLMGSGDWNDGMNRVGIEGRGESVWLGWFLCRVVADFAPLARSRGETARAQRWERAALGWKGALNGVAWDGQWFKRAFFDNGQPLGSHVNPEARIDLIAQAWAVLSGAGAPDLQRMALAAVEENLVDHEAGLLRLLDPPLARTTPSAGYIQAYPPGVRENGGQYSHAGAWALMAQARAHVEAQTQTQRRAAAPREGNDTPYRYFTYLSPAHRARRGSFGATYAIEPYVMAGDVYSQPPFRGRGGWSWYTGSAAWMHRAAIESIFGLTLEAQDLWFAPCLPSAWPRAEITLRRNGRSMRFLLLRAAEPAVRETLAPGRENAGARLLHPGERLRWAELPVDCSLVVPLGDGVPASAPAQTATAGS